MKTPSTITRNFILFSFLVAFFSVSLRAHAVSMTGCSGKVQVGGKMVVWSYFPHDRDSDVLASSPIRIAPDQLDIEDPSDEAIELETFKSFSGAGFQIVSLARQPGDLIANVVFDCFKNKYGPEVSPLANKYNCSAKVIISGNNKVKTSNGVEIEQKITLELPEVVGASPTNEFVAATEAAKLLSSSETLKNICSK